MGSGKTTIASKVADVLNGTGKNVAPIGSVKVICDHNERKKKVETVNTMIN